MPADERKWSWVLGRVCAVDVGAASFKTKRSFSMELWHLLIVQKGLPHTLAHDESSSSYVLFGNTGIPLEYMQRGNNLSLKKLSRHLLLCICFSSGYSKYQSRYSGERNNPCEVHRDRPQELATQDR